MTDIRTPPAPTVERIRALPKVELHCHLEGTLRPDTVADLARAAGRELPVDDPADFYRFANLTEFLEAFWFAQATLVDREAWARAAYEGLVDGAAHGLVYRETFFTPARHLHAGQDLADIVAGIDEGMAAAERDTGVRARLIFDIDRDFGPAVGLAHVEALVDLRRRGAPGTDRLIGVGMDSTELGVDPATYVDAYATARRGGLRVTAHQGENSPAAAAAVAVDVLGVERLDHGFSVMEDPDLVARLAERRLPFTVCPNANVRINPDVFDGIGGHPVDAMRRAGLLVTLNTDDPAFIDLDLTDEYALSAAAFGWGWDDLVDLALAGVEASWADADEQRALRARITAAASRSTQRPIAPAHGRSVAGMAEHDHGATAREYWRAIDARDWDGLRAVLASDVVYRVPQTGEQAIGPERSVRFNAEYPGDWRLSVTTLVADADGAATTIDFVDGDEHQTGIALFTFAPDGRIATIDDWWPEPYEPPPGREHLLDRPDA